MSTAMIAEFTLPNEWDNNNDDMMNDEEISATSHEEASKVFEQWQSDCEELDIMEVDEQIGYNLLGDDIFHDPCISPTGPLEELVLVSFDEEDFDRFSLSILGDDDDVDLAAAATTTTSGTTGPIAFDERYKATISKLAESMKRSQETRKSLQMKTLKTHNYQRRTSVSGVLSSIEKSSQQLQIYLKNIRQS